MRHVGGFDHKKGCEKMKRNNYCVFVWFFFGIKVSERGVRVFVYTSPLAFYKVATIKTVGYSHSESCITGNVAPPPPADREFASLSFSFFSSVIGIPSKMMVSIASFLYLPFMDR